LYESARATDSPYVHVTDIYTSFPTIARDNTRTLSKADKRIDLITTELQEIILP